MADAPTAEKSQKAIVPFLVIPENPAEKPYLLGSRCKGCSAVYLGKRMACSKPNRKCKREARENHRRYRKEMEPYNGQWRLWNLS